MTLSLRCALAALLVIPAALVEAQRSPGACWRPGPLARCQFYVVTELVYELPVAQTSAPGQTFKDFRGRLAFNVGPMWNVSQRDAVGLIAALTTDDPDEVGPGRLELRYRRWANDKVGLDFSAGVARKASYDLQGNNQATASGLTGSVGAEMGLVGAMARVDMLQSHGRTQRAAFVGAKVGGPAGPIAAVLVVTGFFIAIISNGPS